MADHFSIQAADYARHRPTYPPTLFRWLAQLAPSHACAWDCATGNGQAAVGLADHFMQVIATDASAGQLALAFTHERISYRVACAEDSGLPDDSVDLISVAQAYHWLDQPRFLQEARRILRPRGILAVWGYNLLHIGPGIDAVIRNFYTTTVGPYWPSERRHVEEAYRTLPFPDTMLLAPDFAMSAEWNLEQLCGYLRSWSASQRFATVHGHDPVRAVTADLAACWPGSDVHHQVPVSWPLFIMVARFA